MVFSRVGIGYPRFSKMELIAGKSPTKDKKKKVIINETAARLLEYENPIGKNIFLFGGISKREIIGMVKDFHSNTLRDNILPVVMHVQETKERLVLRIANDKVYETLDFIHTKWNELSDTPLNYEFTEDRVEYLYKNEIRFEKLIEFFAAIAILISTMGFFGLVMFSTQQRTKEMGVRKVLGASIFDILKLLSKEFIILVLFGSILGSPIAYYFMNNWLQNFAYKIKITPDIFILALVLALFITLSTIALQGLKTAYSNPVDSLRDE
ncbi:MAG: FtsX-like permease family protein [Ignavibacteriae bacterium]|nr:FtsX-like permease family protein [Ignavibacteriota bacterium]